MPGKPFGSDRSLVPLVPGTDGTRDHSYAATKGLCP